MSYKQHIDRFNTLASNRIPFVFIIDYLNNDVVITELDKVDSNEILFSINGINNISDAEVIVVPDKIYFKKYPISFQEYAKAFDIVKYNLKKGNSYLTNLTFETPIETNLSLKQIFNKSKAPYKLWYKDEFVVFSPEIFVKISKGKIMSFPMKGTIDASVKNAESIILNSVKESAEHATIVDLIRNDLSRVATNIKVEEYRYIDNIKTNAGSLLQVSSKISGNVANDYLSKLGNIIFNLLPAGSITGAPKNKTLDIIAEAEIYNRGFYTGVFGIFDGVNFDSSVMIRFIEQNDGAMVYKSGGGITVNSICEDEYKEMIQKVYLPI